MTANRSAHQPSWRRVAAALRDVHREQVYAWECLCRVSRAPADRPGPLTWTSSLDGPRLVGTWLEDR